MGKKHHRLAETNHHGRSKTVTVLLRLVVFGPVSLRLVVFGPVSIRLMVFGPVSQCRPAVVRAAPNERLTGWLGQLTSEEALTGQKLSYFPSKLAILQVDVLRRMESRRTLRAPTITSELIVPPSRVED